MSLVTLGRADFLRFCLCLYYNAVSGHVKQGWSGQPSPALSARPLLIILTAFLQKISPAANESAPNPDDGLSIFS